MNSRTSFGTYYVQKEVLPMPTTECRNCHRRADSRAFRACTDCGAPLCDDCANEYSGLCPDCDRAPAAWVFHGMYTE